MIKNERLDITLAKGLAIILVVFGHIMAGGVSVGNEWFTTTVLYKNMFHMPFFMFLSGFLYFKIGRLEKISQTYLANMKKQTVRLLLPFLFMGAVVIVGKLIAQHIFHVDNVPDDPLKGFINLIWYTKDSPSVYLWYIFAVFVYCAICPILFQALKYRMHLWVLVGFAIYLIPSSYYLYMYKVTHFFIFFCLGGLAVIYEDKYKAIISNKYLLLVCFSLVVFSFAIFDYDFLDHKFSRLTTALLCIPLLHQLCVVLAMRTNWLSNTLFFIGRRTYSIYLLNTICIGVTKGIMFKFIMDWHGTNFLIVAPILLVAGTLGPIIAEWLILERIPFVRKRILMK